MCFVTIESISLGMDRCRCYRHFGKSRSSSMSGQKEWVISLLGREWEPGHRGFEAPEFNFLLSVSSRRHEDL